ncbi:MAG: DUF6340 family protein [Bacteroidales bacterium]|nr:DUF6340 family protein [Bacteroidales bacterium]
MKKNYSLFFLLILFSLSGCVLMEPISIQVLNPPQINLPAQLKKIVLINHAIRLNSDSSGIRADDSLLTANYFSGLLQKVHTSPQFEMVSDTPKIVYKTHSDRFLSLDTSVIISIAKSSMAEAAIVLENYQVVYNEPIEIHFSPEYGYYGTLSVENISLWKFYDVERAKFIDDYLQKDTLFWDAAGNSEDEIIDQMPRLHTAAVQSCYYAGMKYADRIAPLWLLEQRFLLVPNNWDFYTAWELAQQNKWIEAIEIWRKYAYGKNQRLAALACYNMAVASEVFDNIDAALDWAAKSFLIKNKKYVEEYIRLLEKRKKIKQRLEKP